MRHQEILDHVIKSQDGFVYEKMVDVDGYQIWRCRKPGTRNYCFELVFGKEGVYLNGDINSLVWEHRTGLDFLAGKDVDYYIYQKLGNIYKDKREVDEEAVDRFLSEQMVYWLHNDWKDKGDIQIPWEKPYETLQWPNDSEIILDDIVAFYEKNKLDDDMECKAWDLYTDMRSVEHCDLRGVYETVCQYDPDSFDRSFDKAAYSVIFGMYMACYAARKIKKQEEALAAV